MKICVYAICKNEEKFVPGWMASMGEADGIYVLDTGSSDGSGSALTALGAHVTQEVISPWRFDRARNRSLELVPEDADICVCTDLDELLRPGWRADLEKAWVSCPGRARYRYTWSFLPDGREGVVFLTDKIHCRHGYRWVGPVHEVLSWQGPGPEPAWITIPGIQLDHHPDPRKSRGQYLSLLELAVAEDPENDRNMHYLGREYFFHRRWQDSIDALEHHLSLKTACWADERCASMRYLARDFEELGSLRQAEGWHLRSLAEAPHLREPWMDYAMFAYRREDWDLVIWLTNRALAIQDRELSYITQPECWGSLPHDLAALGYYHTGKFSQALEQAELALCIEPDNERLQNNRRWIAAAAGLPE